MLFQQQYLTRITGNTANEADYKRQFVDLDNLHKEYQ
jgi:hypothetical protein